MEASTNATSYIDICEFPEKSCNIYNFIAYSSTNVASIIINLLHLFMLQRILRVKESNYFWILFNLTLGDIAMSLAVVLVVSCKRWVSLNCFMIVMSYAFGSCVFQIRYWLLLLAVIERYYAVCRPFQYTTSKFISNIGKWTAVAWILNAALALASNIFDHLRFDTIQSEVSKYLTVTVIVATIAPSVISTVLLIKIAAELKNMKRQRNTPGENKESRSATNYIIGVFIMFYISLIPTLVYAGLQVMSKNKARTDFTWLSSLALFTHLLYGIGNVVLYGVLNKAYVAKIKSICQSLCQNTQVHPQ